MKCNATKRIMTQRFQSDFKEIAVDAAKKAYQLHQQEQTTRTIYICLEAMRQCGLSPKTINKAMKIVPAIRDKFTNYNDSAELDEHMGDFALVKGLRDYGIEVCDIPHGE